MKKKTFLILFIMLFTYKVSAQHLFAKDAAHYIHQNVDIAGRVYGGETKPDSSAIGSTITFLYVSGGNYPHQNLIVIIKSIKGYEDFIANIKNGRMPYIYIRGTIFLYNGKAAIELNSAKDIRLLNYKDGGPSPDLQ